ncbi:unnamed protein product [Trichogramma brassicae]|uniref:DUF8207 domain-containing protein n=1 Tax=Trichogramma brassicae TaxID=86971 RepID=A0A6H5I6C4_9HYME|nr:unnamed protein product [Trichogramma brassicae]
MFKTQEKTGIYRTYNSRNRDHSSITGKYWASRTDDRPVKVNDRDDKANYRKILEISSAHRLNNNPTQPVRQWKYSKYTKYIHPMFASTKSGYESGAATISMSNVKEKLVNELHKPARRNFPRRRFNMVAIDDTWQADLVEMIPYAKVNSGYKYLLTVIDNFSKYAWSGLPKVFNYPPRSPNAFPWARMEGPYVSTARK